MNIFSRILHFIDSKGITESKFSEIIGLSNSYMTKMKKGKGNVGSTIVEKIVRQYPELSLFWLITGEGEMLNQPETNNTTTQMNCNDCPYKELVERYQKDIDRYRDEINYLNDQIRTMRQHDEPNRKQRSA